MTSDNYPLARQDNIVIQELKDELLIYDLQKNKAFCLNQTSGLVYQLCDGTKTVAEISDLMSKKLKTLLSEDFVWLAIDGLQRENLLEKSAELEPHFVGVSRREAVKRAGLASLMVLPMIYSIVAPQAAMAQSGCGIANNNANQNFPGCACQSNNDCDNTCCGFGNICAVIDSVPITFPCRVDCECFFSTCVTLPGQSPICL